MTKATKKLSLSLLALVLLCLALAHGAYAENTFTLRYKSGSDGEYTLSVEGLDGTYNVYAVQLELSFSGEYPDVRLVPLDSEVYSPDSAATVNNGQTRLNIYLSSLSPINDGAALTLGTLYSNASGRMIMPASARLTMLGSDLSAISGADGTNISVRSASGGAASSAGTGTRSSVSVGSTEHGTVKSSMLSAQSGARVQLTVTPDSGYELSSLSVTDADGNKLTLTPERSGVYSFRMPDSAVEVNAQFVKQGTAPTAAGLPFSDVNESDWFFSAIQYVYDKGMMNGTDEEHFSPALTTSRAMIVTILYRLEDGPAPASPEFTDVQSGMWYTDAVGWAGANGVVSGYGDGRFGPDSPITREQLAVILYRCAQLKGLDVSVSASLDGFTDAGAVGSYASDAMRWAVGSGLISGKGNGILDPAGSATRAEAAAILTRFCQMA